MRHIRYQRVRLKASIRESRLLGGTAMVTQTMNTFS